MKVLFKNMSALLKIFLFPVIVFGLHILLSKTVDMYRSFPWIDIPMHFGGGVAMMVSIGMLYKSLQKIAVIPHLPLAITRLFLFTIISTITIFWEFAEFTTDFFYYTHAQVSIPDTMKDMFLGMLGGVLVISLFRFIPVIKLTNRDS